MKDQGSTSFPASKIKMTQTSRDGGPSRFE